MSYLVLDLETITDTRLSLPKDRARCGACDTHPNRCKACGAQPEAPFLPPSFHQIIVIGFARVSLDFVIEELDVMTASTLAEEAKVLSELVDYLSSSNPVLLGWNSRGFDLPVVAARALAHGIPFPWYYRFQGAKGPRYRYTHTHHYDVKDFLGDYGGARSGSLDAVASSIGLPGKVGVDGSQVGDLFHRGQLETIANYCATDVLQNIGIALRTELVRGRMSPEFYQTRAQGVVQCVETNPRLSALRGLIRPEFAYPFVEEKNNAEKSV